LKATVSSVAEGPELKEKFPRPKASAKSQAIPKTLATIEKIKQTFAEQIKVQEMIAPYSIASTSKAKPLKEVEIVSETPGVRRSLRNKGQLPSEPKETSCDLLSKPYVEISID